MKFFILKIQLLLVRVR